MSAKKILFLVGPTASGKTEISVKLARRLGAEIISADSMQVYRGMDIGTDKPSSTERRIVPHHMINILSTSENFSVFDFRRRSLDAILKIEKKRRLPLVVGGSGLYIKAILDGLSEQPGASSRLRGRLRRLAAEKGLGFLYSRLEKLDPGAACRINSNDERRIIRALEVYELSKRPLTEWERRTSPLEELGYEARVYGLLWDRPALYKRVEERVEKMFDAGLVKEARRLFKKRLSQTARQAVGYKELFGYFRGEKTLEEAKEEIVKDTRHLVKKQMTWFRKDNRIRWIEMNGTKSVEDAAGEIEKDASGWF
ncbi:MAG: tRNA (adenosine(37)-N6)-dimethylallyltransferase MiaA, partial [Candidatus Omnitrophica bacterium]|nr:tRNA (adenosine(37)-N6)-dimethylallyltransferase MiaA [Candidatus Omnitrophota bacterium]